MGTRHLTCVLKDGEFRVAQYGQWDGYLTGQGYTIADFLQKTYDKTIFAAQIDKVRHLSKDEVMARWNDAGADGSGLVSLDVAEKFRGKNAHLDRDIGAEILNYLMKEESPEVMMTLDFAGDGLFCEWAYVLNLDTEELEIYKGFVQEPLTEKDRFFFLQTSGSEYSPVRVVATLKFSDVSRESLFKLQEELYKKDEEEYEKKKEDGLI